MAREPSVVNAHEPGLRVALSVKPATPADDDAMAVRVDVVEATRPLRISVYLDGDLIDTWAPAVSGYDVVVPAAPGRHLVTARAIDAQGRWGGASMLVDS